MADSVAEYATSCLGLTPPYSIVKDVFGYQYHDGQQTYETDLSVLTQIRLGKQKSVNIAAILVGHEDDFSGAVSRTQVRNIQGAIQIMRNIYGTVNLGVRKIYWQRIGLAQAGGYVNIANRSEAEDLTDDWSSPTDGIDVFFVQSIGDAGGWSNVDGPCSKNSKDDLTGAVVSLTNPVPFLGVLTAHEVAHYLKLSHTNSATNLMGQDANNDGIAELTNANRVLTTAQGNSMKSHCFVKNPC
ncbi:MAG: hypothetical protein A3D92_11880 [Bacteroidetes bacterium RIFCSPHIGHO2_02_FULL_44_7]|nr:MAG: hypothetical protein A3D92_11880 [Bacteroidetes bacterium RIFCSPHIGHO2_02_FULL_44_7]